MRPPMLQNSYPLKLKSTLLKPPSRWQLNNLRKQSIHSPTTHANKNAMDTDNDTLSNANNINQIQIKIPSLIHDLKHKIATFVIET